MNGINRKMEEDPKLTDEQYTALNRACEKMSKRVTAMKIIKVIILEGGRTCREVNRFEKLDYKSYYSEMAPIIGKRAAIDMYDRNNNNWHKAESKLRTFEIAECPKHCESFEDKHCCKTSETIHEAELINLTTVRILR